MFALEGLCSQYQPGQLFALFERPFDIAQALALLELLKQLLFSFGPECRNKYVAKRQRSHRIKTPSSMKHASTVGGASRAGTVSSLLPGTYRTLACENVSSDG